MLYWALWAYRTSVKTATGFSPFQLVYGLEAVLPIECQIPSLKLAVQLLPGTSPLEEWLVHLEHLYEQHRDATHQVSQGVLTALQVEMCLAITVLPISEMGFDIRRARLLPARK